MAKALLISVGGSHQPVVHSLNQQEPDYVIYFASSQSRSMIRQEIEPALHYHPLDHDIIVTPDPNNLVESVAEIMRKLPRLLEMWGLTNEDITGDYTGGTKTMSAAVVLALADHGCRYSYVGGKIRNKDGLGTVQDGHEEMVSLENPWDTLAVGPLRDIALLFNRCRFRSAHDLAQRTAGRTDKLKNFFSNLQTAIYGYLCWDNFIYNKALGSLGKARNWFGSAAEMKGHPAFIKFAEALVENQEHVKRVKDQYDTLTQGTQTASQASVDDRPLVLDLLANAKRRGEVEHKYDDAVARLYTALEKMAKIKLLMAYGVDNSNLDLSKVPDQALRDELTATCQDRDGRVRLPLFKSYSLLAALGDDLGEKYRTRTRDLEKILEVRNMSLLAHGFKAVKQETYQTLMGIALEFAGATTEELPRFPMMDWSDALL